MLPFPTPHLLTAPSQSKRADICTKLMSKIHYRAAKCGKNAEINPWHKNGMVKKKPNQLVKKQGEQDEPGDVC